MNFKIILTAILFVIPTLALAQPVYKPLVGIPGIDNPGLDFEGYLNALYALSIAVAAFLAVIKIIIGGLKWMLSDVVTSKAEAKKEIQGATIGLLVVISAVLILTTINPDLASTNLFSQTDATDASVSGGLSSNMPTVGPNKIPIETINEENERLLCINAYAGEWYVETPQSTNAWCIVNRVSYDCTISKMTQGQIINPITGLSQHTQIPDCTEAVKQCQKFHPGATTKDIKSITGVVNKIACVI